MKHNHSHVYSKLTSKTVFMDVYVDDGVYTADTEAEEGASLHAGFTTLHVSQCVTCFCVFGDLLVLLHYM